MPRTRAGDLPFLASIQSIRAATNMLPQSYWPNSPSTSGNAATHTAVKYTMCVGLKLLTRYVLEATRHTTPCDGSGENDEGNRAREVRITLATS
jgi:hypothetical protein